LPSMLATTALVARYQLAYVSARHPLLRFI
jgi:hypothetical protein